MRDYKAMLLPSADIELSRSEAPWKVAGEISFEPNGRLLATANGWGVRLDDSTRVGWRSESRFALVREWLGEGALKATIDIVAAPIGMMASAIACLVWVSPIFGALLADLSDGPLLAYTVSAAIGLLVWGAADRAISRPVVVVEGGFGVLTIKSRDFKSLRRFADALDQ